MVCQQVYLPYHAGACMHALYHARVYVTLLHLRSKKHAVLQILFSPPALGCTY